MSASREQRLQAILHAYLQAIDRGEKLDRQQILDAHPDLRQDLAEFFADASKLDRMARSLKTTDHTPQPDASPTSPGPVATRLPTIRYFGDYEVLEEIARGGMGVVHKARQVSLNRIVALKMILKGELASEADVRRFRQEAEAAANLDHPNIVPIYEVGEHEGQQYFSMKLITSASPPPSAQPFRAAVGRLARVARAVHHAHQRGILHRDLKPSNILVDTTGEPHVADFGLAKKVSGGEQATRSGAIVGTPAYMAPEQARAEKSLTIAIDVYSLGAILYEWLTGRPPFRGDDAVSTLLQVVRDEPTKPRSLDPAIDRDLETICLHCLEKEPARRYGSAEALALDLERWLRGEPIEARAVGKAERLWRWSRRNPVLAGMIGIVLTLVFTVAIGSSIAAIRIAGARDDARRAQLAEAEERQKAEAHADEAKKRLARQYVGNAVRVMEDSDLLGALPWLVEALRQDLGQPEREKMQRLRIGSALQECPRLAHLWFPPHEVIDLSFVAGRLRVVTASETTVQVHDAMTGEQLGRPLAHEGPARSVGFSPDGKRLVLAAGLGSLKNPGMVVWDLASGSRVCKLEGAEQQATWSRGTFSPDGKRILVQRHWSQNPYFFGGEAGMWDAQTGKKLTLTHSFYGTSDGWLAGAFGGQAILSADGKRVAHLSGGAFWVWDADTGKRISPVDAPHAKGPPQPNHGSGALHAAFSPDGKRLAVGFGSDHPLQPGSVGVYDIASGKPVAPLLRSPAGILHVAFSSNAELLHVMAADCTRWVWDMKDTDSMQRHMDLTRHELPASAPWLSPNGIHAAVVRYRQILVWNLATNTPVTPVLRHEGTVKYAAFDQEGCRLATAGPDMPVRVFDFGGALPTFPGREYTALRVNRVGQVVHGFSPDGKRAVLRSWTDASALWDLEKEQPLTTEQYFSGLSHAQDWSLEHPIQFETRKLSSGKTEFRLGDFATGKQTRITIPGNPRGEHGWGMMTPDGCWFIGEGLTTGTQIWDAGTGQLQSTLTKRPTYIFKCSPDSRTLVGFDRNGDSQAWDIPSGKTLWSLAKAHLDWSEYEISPDSQFLVVARSHGKRDTVEVCDLRTGRNRFEPIQLASPVARFCLSPDSQKLFTLDAAHRCRLWNACTGEPLGPEWTSDLHSWAAFSGDSNRIFLSSDQFLGRVWDPVQGKPLGPPISAMNSWYVSPDARTVFATFHPHLRPGMIAQSGTMRSHLVETETGLPLTPQLRDYPSNWFHFSADGKRLLFMVDSIVHRRDLVVEDRSPEELHDLVLALSRHYIDESESFVMADRDTFEKAWRRHRARHLPRDLGYTARQRLEWHTQAVIDCLNARFWDGAIHPDGAAWSGALHHLHHALEARPDSAALHHLRAQAWEKLGDDARAMADLDRAAVLDPRGRNIWESRGWLHLRQGRLAQAEADLDRALDLCADDHRVAHHLALLYLEAGKLAEYRAVCLRLLDNLTTQGPYRAEEVFATLVLHPQGVDPARILALLPKKLEYQWTHKIAAIAHLRARQYAQALDHLERYLKEEGGADPLPEGVDRLWAALIFHHAGKKDEARTWLQRARQWQDKESKRAEWDRRTEFSQRRRELERGSPTP